MPETTNYEPTREEITRICKEIREGWSEKELYRRAGFRDGKPPVESKPLRLNLGN